MIWIWRLAPALGAAVVVGMLAACSSIRHENLVDLPTVPGGGGGCRGLALTETTLHGAQADPRKAWLVRHGSRVELLWPEGYKARFAPDLEVFDPDGTIRYREGDAVTSACAVRGDADHELLMDPDGG